MSGRSRWCIGVAVTVRAGARTYPAIVVWDDGGKKLTVRSLNTGKDHSESHGAVHARSARDERDQSTIAYVLSERYGHPAQDVLPGYR